MQLNYASMNEAYERFRGKVVYTNDLREFQPNVFDSKNHGHSCNCTFLFCILNYIGYTDGTILGAGRIGSPFHIQFANK